MELKYDNESKYVIAVSCGVDSMVLLNLAMKNNLNFIVAHVNHNKRNQSIDEENFITNFCKQNNIQLEILQFNNNDENFQNEARIQRYNFFYNVAIKYNCNTILTAHHSYDNVETILMNILRGSNLKGYAGMSVSNINNILIQRPLLEFSKKKIYKYAKDNNVIFFEDESNLDNAYLRNNIRNNILNNLEDINGNFDIKFSQYSNLLLETFNFIRNTSLSYIIDNKVNINIFNKLDICIKKDILNYLFEINNLSSSTSKINDCIKLIENNKPNLSYNIQRNYKLIKDYTDFYLSNYETKQLCYIMEDFGKCEIDLNKTFYFTNILPKTYTYFTKIWYNKQELPLKIRTRLNGDKIAIKNGHKSVSDFFIDKKIPKENRDKILLVENNNNEIIWIIDYYKKNVDKDFIYLVYEEKTDE